MYNKALSIAAWAHDGQHRKGTDTPYIIHPVRVGRLIEMYGGSDELVAAGLLHDVLEDAGDKYSKATMRRDFGDAITGIVLEVSERKTSGEGTVKPWRERKLKYIAHLSTASEGALLVAAADKLDNLTSLFDDYTALGEEVWSRFNAGKKEQLWYYDTVLETLRKSRLEGEVLQDLERSIKNLREVV
jgi:(p)ppGpp synthase/HD superfamily hydrolase